MPWADSRRAQGHTDLGDGFSFADTFGFPFSFSFSWALPKLLLFILILFWVDGVLVAVFGDVDFCVDDCFINFTVAFFF
jgi:hypothetical protein